MNNLKVLVVDDDPVTLVLLDKKVRRAGYEVKTAKNGVEAIDCLSKQHYDVVVTDLMMPGGVDGIGVLEAVKEKSSQTEVILITAYASVDTAIKAMKKGASDYLQKPINFDELILRLEKISTMKSLVKNASDLRDAMDVTESHAAETIQELELLVSTLEEKVAQASEILTRKGIDPPTRVNIALDVLNTT
ncbi:MAG: response regulator [Desulfatiglans sp.]|jgi:DNA-binding NtrC family response regulator|nr:response regulator [Thermodesulfobacteriota bacterium]MEE4351442.1 response regulator [Desulfatiglans sp.]